MNLKEYRKKIEKTWIINKYDIERIILGICGESGEIAEVYKKYLRGDICREKLIHNLRKEIGDELYYLVKLCNHLKLDIERILDLNINKLNSRKQRNKIKGSGNNR